MAKELPYFKFEPAEYLTKDISFCSLSAQGLFINICSYYWQRNCKLTKEQLLKRLNYETELNELISEGVIDLKDNIIVIKFLDLQLVEVAKTSKTNSINGSKGGRPRKPKQNQKETEKKPTALIPLSETKGIREDKIILDKNIVDEKTIDNIFLEHRQKYRVYANQLFNDTVFVESISKEFIRNESKEVIQLTLKKYLSLFLNSLDQTKKIHNNKKEFQIHFPAWMRKQPAIVKVYPKEKEIRYS